jgi:hypothetical protein
MLLSEPNSPETDDHRCLRCREGTRQVLAEHNDPLSLSLTVKLMITASAVPSAAS